MIKKKGCIADTLTSNTASVVIQNSLFYALIAALSDCKRGSVVKLGCSLDGRRQ